MEDVFAVHELNGLEYLEHVVLDFVEGERLAFVLEGLVEVHFHQLEDESELACVSGAVPVGSSKSTSMSLMMFSWLLRMLRAWISFSFLIFSTESNFFFMHLIATCLPVFSESAMNTTENVPLPFSAYNLYWSIELSRHSLYFLGIIIDALSAVIVRSACHMNGLPRISKAQPLTN